MSVSHSQGQWQLCSEQGECFGGFDALLLTCPPEQARQLLEGAALSLHIPQQLLLPCWAVLLELATPTHHPAEATLVQHGKTRWIAKQSAKPGRHSARLQENLPEAPEQWLVHLSAEASAAELETMPEQISALAAAELSLVLGTEVKVAAALCHRWLYASYNSEVQPCGVLFDPQLLLALCGDWTLGGRVENAWLSGVQAAQQLLQRHVAQHASPQRLTRIAVLIFSVAPNRNVSMQQRRLLVLGAGSGIGQGLLCYAQQQGAAIAGVSRSVAPEGL